MAMTETQVVGTELETVRASIPTLFDMESGEFFPEIAKGEVEVVSNRDMRIPLAIRPGGRFAHWNPAGGDLGRGEGPTYDKALITPVHLRHAIEYQTLTKWSTDDRRKSIKNVIKDLVAGGMVEFKRAVDALAVSSDGTGVLGTVYSVSTAGGKDTTVLTNDYGIRLTRFGQMLSVYDSTLATRRTFTGGASDGGEAPIDLYDIASQSVRFNGTTGATVAGDKLVVGGLTATPPVSMYGVPYHVSSASTGTWLGLDRANFPEVRANRVDAGGVGLALPFPRLAINKVGDRMGKSINFKPVAWMHPCQVQAYEELGQLVTVINKQMNSGPLDLYFGNGFGDGMNMAGVATRTHFSWNKTRIDYIVKSNWGRAEMHAADLYEVDGRTLFPIYGDSGGIAASQVFYTTASFNIYLTNPAEAAYISSLAIPDGYGI